VQFLLEDKGRYFIKMLHSVHKPVALSTVVCKLLKFWHRIADSIALISPLILIPLLLSGCFCICHMKPIRKVWILLIKKYQTVVLGMFTRCRNSCAVSSKKFLLHVISKMQLICETLFPPRTSVTITFLTYSSFTSQSIAVVTTATFIPVYLFIARQSRDHMSGVTHQNLIGYISATSKPIHFWFSVVKSLKWKM